MTCVLPAEHIEGTYSERQRLRQLLIQLRAVPEPMRLPGTEIHPLSELLNTAMIDRDLFDTGYALMRRRYTQIGLSALLPLDRVWVGTRSAVAAGTHQSYGGFHHPGQGYRHLQMDATITVYGDLTRQTPAAPHAIALDLIRSYAHDCLHYGTCRRYQLGPDGGVRRTQYGINFRSVDGRTYSAPDKPGMGATRNLGILMEGATDTEATSIAREAAKLCGITDMGSPAELAPYAYLDLTGTLTRQAIDAALGTSHPYLRSLGIFNRTVTVRYRTLLDELADEPDDLHAIFVAAIISGDLTALDRWLATRHGPGTFARLFKATSWDAPPAR
jgi:hypothetical protein